VVLSQRDFLDSGHWLVAFLERYKIDKTDPFLTVGLLHTGQSAKSRLCEQEGYKAAVGDLTQSAKTGR
jgi:hypothetical protein